MSCELTTLRRGERASFISSLAHPHVLAKLSTLLQALTKETEASLFAFCSQSGKWRMEATDPTLPHCLSLGWLFSRLGGFSVVDLKEVGKRP